MNLHKKILAAVALSASLFALTAQAHDPSLHAPARKPVNGAKAMPVTCADLNDPARYSTDVKDPEVKALKFRCDAEKRKPAAAAVPTKD